LAFALGVDAPDGSDVEAFGATAIARSDATALARRARARSNARALAIAHDDESRANGAVDDSANDPHDDGVTRMGVR